MVFRRIIIEPTNLTIEEINLYLNSRDIKNRYPNCKIILKPSLKPNVFIIDIRGEGGDGLSKRLKTTFQQFCEQKIKIKKEIKLIPKNNYL